MSETCPDCGGAMEDDDFTQEQCDQARDLVWDALEPFENQYDALAVLADSAALIIANAPLDMRERVKHDFLEMVNDAIKGNVIANCDA